MSALCVAALGFLFPECPPIPLTPQPSSPASHAPHFLPREGRCLGTFEQALGMQFEAETRVTQEKGKRGEERGLDLSDLELPSPA